MDNGKKDGNDGNGGESSGSGGDGKVLEVKKASLAWGSAKREGLDSLNSHNSDASDQEDFKLNVFEPIEFNQQPENNGDEDSTHEITMTGIGIVEERNEMPYGRSFEQEESFEVSMYESTEESMMDFGSISEGNTGPHKIELEIPVINSERSDMGGVDDDSEDDSEDESESEDDEFGSYNDNKTADLTGALKRSRELNALNTGTGVDETGKLFDFIQNEVVDTEQTGTGVVNNDTETGMEFTEFYNEVNPNIAVGGEWVIYITQNLLSLVKDTNMEITQLYASNVENMSVEMNEEVLDFGSMISNDGTVLTEHPDDITTSLPIHIPLPTPLKSAMGSTSINIQSVQEENKEDIEQRNWPNVVDVLEIRKNEYIQMEKFDVYPTPEALERFRNENQVGSEKEKHPKFVISKVNQNLIRLIEQFKERLRVASTDLGLLSDKVTERNAAIFQKYFETDSKGEIILNTSGRSLADQVKKKCTEELSSNEYQSKEKLKRELKETLQRITRDKLVLQQKTSEVEELDRQKQQEIAILEQNMEEKRKQLEDIQSKISEQVELKGVKEAKLGQLQEKVKNLRLQEEIWRKSSEQSKEAHLELLEELDRTKQLQNHQNQQFSGQDILKMKQENRVLEEINHIRVSQSSSKRFVFTYEDYASVSITLEPNNNWLEEETMARDESLFNDSRNYKIEIEMVKSPFEFDEFKPGVLDLIDSVSLASMFEYVVAKIQEAKAKKPKLGYIVRSAIKYLNAISVLSKDLFLLNTRFKSKLFFKPELSMPVVIESEMYLHNYSTKAVSKLHSRFPPTLSIDCSSLSTTHGIIGTPKPKLKKPRKSNTFMPGSAGTKPGFILDKDLLNIDTVHIDPECYFHLKNPSFAYWIPGNSTVLVRKSLSEDISSEVVTATDGGYSTVLSIEFHYGQPIAALADITQYTSPSSKKRGADHVDNSVLELKDKLDSLYSNVIMSGYDRDKLSRSDIHLKPSVSTSGHNTDNILLFHESIYKYLLGS
ncbi:hypothetical protein AX774_g8231 [Zancudomyces culisetae]|uniref:Spc7 kinetochore protein domain-containing protein n=1 Tax=Zancudomyces culisetae TaxID=1213189 RepID=A0A1R1PBP1_ZANCU|nr:hypothetical protein AX774_g8231 [Zancudomyces culisetae]|eukprot:OMH78386.1 hypothetical protein AX774_g8231 [Zancudomyces culisetae]